MFYSSNLYKLSVFVQLSTPIQTQSSYYVKIVDPESGKFRRINNSLRKLLKILPEPKNILHEISSWQIPLLGRIVWGKYEKEQ